MVAESVSSTNRNYARFQNSDRTHTKQNIEINRHIKTCTRYANRVCYLCGVKLYFVVIWEQNIMKEQKVITSVHAVVVVITIIVNTIRKNKAI